MKTTYQKAYEEIFGNISAMIAGFQDQSGSVKRSFSILLGVAHEYAAAREVYARDADSPDRHSALSAEIALSSAKRTFDEQFVLCGEILKARDISDKDRAKAQEIVSEVKKFLALDPRRMSVSATASSGSSQAAVSFAYTRVQAPKPVPVASSSAASSSSSVAAAAASASGVFAKASAQASAPVTQPVTPPRASTAVSMPAGRAAPQSSQAYRSGGTSTVQPTLPGPNARVAVQAAAARANLRAVRKMLGLDTAAQQFQEPKPQA